MRLGLAEMMIRIQPDLEVWSKHSPEAITLQQLDWSNLRVVAAVLGQSVALDYYARLVTLSLQFIRSLASRPRSSGRPDYAC